MLLVQTQLGAGLLSDSLGQYRAVLQSRLLHFIDNVAAVRASHSQICVLLLPPPTVPFPRLLRPLSLPVATAVHQLSPRTTSITLLSQCVHSPLAGAAPGHPPVPVPAPPTSRVTL